MNAIITIAWHEILIASRNLWLVIASGLMMLFAVVLTLAGSGAASSFGVDQLAVVVTSLTTLSVYLVPLIALLLAFDAVAGEIERGGLALTLTYPLSRASFLAGKFLSHILILAFALALGYSLAGVLSFWLGGAKLDSLTALVKLYGSALLLGAAFLGLGYTVSGLTREISSAAGLAMCLWLVGVVIYDLGLLGALIVDNGGFFTTTLFPWLLVANPADAFRIINLTGSEVKLLADGLLSGKAALPSFVPLVAVLTWPSVAMVMAWFVFRRIEP